ncbi:hypothetical protein H3S89_08550 [Bartonella sp. B10834G6]|uniref:hypothetical protein n=1 Tax=Bartonella apis TaxID=1686310 RepID=UPI0018DE25C2|nr:hypothetical protein [Bartonella apis]MBH9982841.1 hypothetical protein [Bartonella apis]
MAAISAVLPAKAGTFYKTLAYIGCADISHRVPSPPGIYALADELGGVIIKRLEVVFRPGADEIEVEVISDNPHHKPHILNLSEITILGRYIDRFTR